MKIIGLWSPPRRPVEPTPANCVAGHPVNSQESTLLRSFFAGFQCRVRSTSGLSRAGAAALAAGTALLALTGCMTAVSKADVADVIVIAATATANEPAPALSLADIALLQATAGSSASAVAFVVNPADGQPIQLALTPRRSDGQVEYGPRRPQILAQNVSRVESQISHEAGTGPFDLLTTMLDAARASMRSALRFGVRCYEPTGCGGASPASTSASRSASGRPSGSWPGVNPGPHGRR